MASIPPSSALSIAQHSKGESASYPLSSSFRRRLGRAASPPTWTWYEHITPANDSNSDDSNSDADQDDDEDEDDDDEQDDEEHDEQDDDERTSERDAHSTPEQFHMEIDAVKTDEDTAMDTATGTTPAPSTPPPPPSVQDAPLAVPAPPTPTATADADTPLSETAKGKQRQVPPSPAISRKTSSSNASRRRQQQQDPQYRPILTIHRSHGFVWNQDLFVPAYIKDRYVTSTSPPVHSACLSSSTSSPSAHGNTGGAPFDPVDVVEIRVTGNELDPWVARC